MLRYLTRFKVALREHASLPLLVDNISKWFNAWKSGSFVDGWSPDNEYAKTMTFERLQRQITRLSSIVRRESAAIARKDGEDSGLGVTPEEHYRHQTALIGPLEIQYEPAGNLRELGPRHDNDFEDIQMISIPPTQDEMRSPIAPFLPANIPGAPHHLGMGTMERLIDIQFLLLREELL
jgi:hypothetical protein